MKPSRTFDLIGTLSTYSGSFLPWESAGGFLHHDRFGIQVDLASVKYWITGIHSFPVLDYGGGVVILLTSAIVLLAIHPPRSHKKPFLWNLIVSAVLLLLSLFFVVRWLIHLYECIFIYSHVFVETPSLMIGLLFVIFGSALLFLNAILKHRQVKIPKSTSAG